MQTKRTLWQQIAFKKYPKLFFLGGDGSGSECFIILTKCPHQQTRSWRYSLRATQAAADELKSQWDKNGCSYTCAREHKVWRLWP